MNTMSTFCPSISFSTASMLAQESPHISRWLPGFVNVAELCLGLYLLWNFVFVTTWFFVSDVYFEVLYTEQVNVKVRGPGRPGLR